MDLKILHTKLLTNQARSLVQREYYVRRNLVNGADEDTILGFFNRNDTRRAMLNLLLYHELVADHCCTVTSSLVEHARASKPTVLSTMERAGELGALTSWTNSKMQMCFKPTQQLLDEYNDYIRQWWEYTFESGMELDYFAIRGILHAMDLLDVK